MTSPSVFCYLARARICSSDCRAGGGQDEGLPSGWGRVVLLGKYKGSFEVRRTATKSVPVIGVIVCRPAGGLTGGDQGGAALTPFLTGDAEPQRRSKAV